MWQPSTSLAVGTAFGVPSRLQGTDRKIGSPRGFRNGASAAEIPVSQKYIIAAAVHGDDVHWQRCQQLFGSGHTGCSSTPADRTEPPHIHVERDECLAKFWLDPVRLESSRGFARAELRRIEAYY